MILSMRAKISGSFSRTQASLAAVKLPGELSSRARHVGRRSARTPRSPISHRPAVAPDDRGAQHAAACGPPRPARASGRRCRWPRTAAARAPARASTCRVAAHRVLPPFPRVLLGPPGPGRRMAISLAGSRRGRRRAPRDGVEQRGLHRRAADVEAEQVGLGHERDSTVTPRGQEETRWRAGAGGLAGLVFDRDPALARSVAVAAARRLGRRRARGQEGLAPGVGLPRE